MNYICAMDLGGYQFKLVIASINDSGEMEILGATKKRTESIQDGKVVNLKNATDTLKAAFEEVTNLSGLKEKEINHFFCNVTGSNIKGYDGTLNNVISIEHSDRRITQADIDKVIKNAHAEGLYEDSEIIHKIPRYFDIDNTSFIKNPYGLEGQKLSVNTYIIATSKYQMNNLRNVIRDALGVKNPVFVLNSIASSEAILSEEHKKIGVVIVDIGGENVDVAAYTQGSLLFASSFQGGGKEITLDLAREFSLAMDTAEKLKSNFEKVITSGKTAITIETIGGLEAEIRVPSIKRDIVDKFNSIFGNTYNKLQYYVEQERFSAGIVLTGGTSMTYDIISTAASHFHVLTQLGQLTHPLPGVENMEYTAEYATAMGLLLWGRRRLVEKGGTKTRLKMNTGNLLERIKGYFKNINED
ncbi:cell division protein FtsA [bacterium]|nr:cell division protein FtsA [bacterium]